MLAHFSKVLRNRPLLAVEHMMYILLILAGVWGLHPSNTSLTIERLVNEVGVYAVVMQFASSILVGVAGHLSIITVRIEHRVVTTMMAFLTFAYGFVANMLILIFGGLFNPVSLTLNVSWALVAGITHLHLRIRQNEGATGRWGCKS